MVVNVDGAWILVVSATGWIIPREYLIRGFVPKELTGAVVEFVHDVLDMKHGCPI